MVEIDSYRPENKLFLDITPEFQLQTLYYIYGCSVSMQQIF